MQVRAAFPWLAIAVCLALTAPLSAEANEETNYGISPTGRIEPATAGTTTPGATAPTVTSTTPVGVATPPMPVAPAPVAVPTAPMPVAIPTTAPTPVMTTPGAITPGARGYPAPPPPGWSGAAVIPAPSYTPGAYRFDEEAPVAPPAGEAPVAPIEAVPADEAPIVVDQPADVVIEQGVPAPPPPGTPTIRTAPPPPQWGGQLQRSPNVMWNGQAEQSCVPACGQRRDKCCWPVDECGRRYGCWEVTLLGTFGWLNDPDGVLGTQAFGFPNQFDWDQAIDYGTSFGARGGVKYAVKPQEWVEVRGGYLGKWDGAGSQVGVFGFQPANNFVAGGHQRDGVSNDVLGTLSSEAELYYVEGNYVSELSCSGCFRWDLIAGARFMQFDERASVDFANAPITGFTGPSFVRSDVENQFIGVQLGANWHWDINNCFNILATLKIMAGNVRRKATVTDQSIFAGGPHRATSEEDQIVLGGDFEIMGRWRVTRYLTVVGGYNFLVLDGVLCANDAMDFGNSFSGAVQAQQETDQMIYHGFFAGVQLTF